MTLCGSADTQGYPAKPVDYTGMTEAEFVMAREQIEDLIGLKDYYRIKGETVEKLYDHKPKRAKSRKWQRK